MHIKGEKRERFGVLDFPCESVVQGLDSSPGASKTRLHGWSMEINA